MAAAVAAALMAVAPAPSAQTAERPAVVWAIDNLQAIGGHAVGVLGSPRVVTTPHGPAVEFNGESDGLLVESNPIAGARAFRIEVDLAPAAGGPAEQRFLHIQQADADNRALLELRMLTPESWCLDTFLRFGPPGLALIDRGRAHRAGEWHTVALSYDGVTMAHEVDGVRELSGAVAFGPMGAGRTSIGVRQNRVSWFKGRMRQVRFYSRSAAGTVTPLAVGATFAPLF
jgi:hypothetical protein